MSMLLYVLMQNPFSSNELTNPPQDLRNHGDSSHHPRHDYTVMAEDVENFIKEHNMKRPVLMGHSM